MLLVWSNLQSKTKQKKDLQITSKTNSLIVLGIVKFKGSRVFCVGLRVSCSISSMLSKKSWERLFLHWTALVWPQGQISTPHEKDAVLYLVWQVGITHTHCSYLKDLSGKMCFNHAVPTMSQKKTFSSLHEKSFLGSKVLKRFPKPLSVTAMEAP